MAHSTGEALRVTPLAKALQALEDLALRPEHDEAARQCMAILTTTPRPTAAEWRIAQGIAYSLTALKPISREARVRLIESVLDEVER